MDTIDFFMPFILSPSRRHRKTIFEKQRTKKYNIHSDCWILKRTEDEKKLRDHQNNQHILDTEFMRRRNSIRSNNKWKYEQKVRGVKEYGWTNSLHKKNIRKTRNSSLFLRLLTCFTCFFSNLSKEIDIFFAIDDAIAILKMIISSEPYVCCICIYIFVWTKFILPMSLHLSFAFSVIFVCRRDFVLIYFVIFPATVDWLLQSLQLRIFSASFFR